MCVCTCMCEWVCLISRRAFNTDIMKIKKPICLKPKMSNKCMASVVTYEIEIWKLTKKRRKINKKIHARKEVSMYHEKDNGKRYFTWLNHRNGGERNTPRRKVITWSKRSVDLWPVNIKRSIKRTKRMLRDEICLLVKQGWEQHNRSRNGRT